MHIPDWDDGFLAEYDPRSIAAAANEAGADAAMLYFQSHLGLCYYPTIVGVRHKAAQFRDLAGEALAALATAEIPVCAYYSVNFNNQAWREHPEWRLQPAAPATIGILPRERYGIVCLNNADYCAFVDAQIAEIAAYSIDAFFFDMVWWNGVCTCQACRGRYLREESAEIPTVIDWSSPVWTRFQSARERWLADFAAHLRAQVHAVRPQADVYHNFALGLSNWTRGVGFDSVTAHDFLGGDFYGGRAEQLVVTRLMLNLTPNKPAEFMTTAAVNLTEHLGLRPIEEMQRKALAAIAADAAFLAIVAIDPAGTINAEAIARVRAGFDAARPFEKFQGGDPVEEVGLYCSDYSKLAATAVPQMIENAPAASRPDYPHFDALIGAARILQESHIPFGVLTRANLAHLDRWPVIVLANVERMSDVEVAAVRAYVEGGGRLYASRNTSLFNLSGRDGVDFALADIFGAHFEREEEGPLVYARTETLDGQKRPLPHRRAADGRSGSVRLRPGGGEVLARLTTPFGYPHPGSVLDTHWASIHSSPPWEDTELPLIVRKTRGLGQTIYSAFDVETGNTVEHDQLFLFLILDLLGRAPLVVAEAHKQVWMSVFSRPTQLTILLINYALDWPALPVPFCRVRFNLPGHRVKSICSVPDFMRLEMTEDATGLVEVEVGPIDLCKMLVVELEDCVI